MFTVREKSSPANFGLFWSKFAPFWPEINILAYIFQTVRWILLIFGIETYLMVFFWKIGVYSPGKIQRHPLWVLFGPNLPPFWPKINIWALYLPNSSLNFADFGYRKFFCGLLLGNWGLQSGKNLAPPILGPFWSKFGPFWVQHISKACLWLGVLIWV